MNTRWSLYNGPAVCPFCRDVSGDNDLWLLSQDIDSAMEKFMSLSNDESVTAILTSEKFTPVKLLMDDLRVDEGKLVRT